MTKIKSGTAFTLITGEPVWMEHDKQDGTATVCFNQKRELTDYYEVVKISDLKPLKQGRTPISSKPKRLNEKEKTEKQLLNEFYNEIGLTMSFLCQECNQPLHAFNKFARRSCAAHILSKSDFPSIATNKDNIIFLGAGFLGGCHCHDAFDIQGAEHRSKMKVYPLCLQRFEKLKQYLNDKEINKARTYLNIKYQ
jgi:hypothetical protein